MNLDKSKFHRKKENNYQNLTATKYNVMLTKKKENNHQNLTASLLVPTKYL